jgi:hypothetical protein
MDLCPVCKTPGAYIGFNTVECRNPDCEHFVIVEEKVCPCCGRVDHLPNCSAAPANSGACDPAVLPANEADSEAGESLPS